MTEKEYKEHIQYTHNAYCRIVIRHASIDAARMLFAKWKREISLEYLTEEKFVPLSTTDEYFQVPDYGETVIELLTRSKYLLSVSGEKWTDRQKTRAKILFRMFPKIKEAYTLICSLRSVFSNKSIDRGTAKVKLHEWYQKVSACTLREVKAARDAIKYKEEEVLNYFINRSTNAHAESLNSKLKGFRAQLRGVQDLPFFMFRASIIFG